MENVIESKGDIFLQLWHISPMLAIFFLISTLAVLVLITIGIIAKFNPGLFNKIIDNKEKFIPKKERRHHMRRKDDAQKDETITGQIIAMRKDFDGRFNFIDKKITELRSTVTSTSELLDKVSEGTLLNMLFNENLDDYNRMKAFVRLTAMNVNSDVKTKGVELALHNKEVWKIVLDDIRKKELILIIVNQKYYDDVMNEINKAIWR